MSSTSQRLCLSQNSLTAPRSNGLPRVWAIITALVLSDNAPSSLVTSILYCGIVTSTNTGTAPYWIAGVIVVGNPAATVIISSPLLILLSPNSGEVRAMKALRLADEPELTTDTYLTLRYSPSCFSNCSVYLPDVSQNSNAESTRFIISLLSYTRLA